MKEITIAQKIGKNLKELRKLAKLTQTEIASYLNMKQPHYARYESGERQLSYEKIELICLILKITPNDLYGIYPESYNNKVITTHIKNNSGVIITGNNNNLKN